MHETLPCIIVSNVAFSRIGTKDKMREDLIDCLREAGCLADPPKLQQNQSDRRTNKQTSTPMQQRRGSGDYFANRGRTLSV